MASLDIQEAMVGVENSSIQTLDRWHSDAFLQYIQPPKESLATLLETLANPVLLISVVEKGIICYLYQVVAYH